MASTPQRTISQRAVIIDPPGVMERWSSSARPHLSQATSCPQLGQSGADIAKNEPPTQRWKCLLPPAVAKARKPKHDCRSELQCPGMPDRDQARLGEAARTDLPKDRPHFVDEKVDHVAGTLGTKRGQTPQEGLSGKNRVSAERYRSHHIE